MKQRFDLSGLEWTVEGYTPFVWLFERLYGGMGSNGDCIDVAPVPTRVPGSVQGALREAGILPDWNIGVQSRACEWVEHRHWMYRAALPDEWLKQGLEAQATFRLECQGLDYCGWVYLNRSRVGEFTGSHIPHTFDLTPFLVPGGNVLEIIFDLPPRWLGQFGYSSQMREWKPRFNYTWDWVPRLLQVGIWDSIDLVAVDEAELGLLQCTSSLNLQSGRGELRIQGELTGAEDSAVELALEQDGRLVRRGLVNSLEFTGGVEWIDLPVEAWWPNLEGAQPLYTLTCRLLDRQGREQDRLQRRIGFKHVQWTACEGAPPEADPWLCRVNGRTVFLQGVNFAPLCANFADLRREDYEKRLRQYRDLGLNLLRINACQFLEREWFYDLCDELGLLVWQEFPLTSSGIDNWPPEDEASIAAMEEIARSFIERRRDHVSLLLWSGGNELQGDLEGHHYGMGKPCGSDHPMLRRLQEVAAELDPAHRFILTSPAGPRAGASPADFGKGLHWDVHGGAAMGSLEDALSYWAGDDALFRSEIYCPGASPLETIQKYAGSFEIFPPTSENPYWTRLTTWWLDWDRLVQAHGRQPAGLAEYVAWSQARQAQMLSLEIKACKERFPGCGGVLLWSGHDTFPLAINSSLIDFDGQLKPSALAVSEVWRGPAGHAQETQEASHAF